MLSASDAGIDAANAHTVRVSIGFHPYLRRIYVWENSDDGSIPRVGMVSHWGRQSL